MKAAFTAIDIARYLVWLAAHENEDEPCYLTPLQLQKLLYYVQGWAVAERAPLFTDEIRAWRHGPVVRSVYDAYKHFGKKPIVDIPDAKPELTPEADAIVRGVWDRYKVYSALKLAEMTHDETPWKEARKSCGDRHASDVTIPLEDLKREFTNQIERSRERLAAHAKQVRALAKYRARRQDASGGDLRTPRSA